MWGTTVLLVISLTLFQHTTQRKLYDDVSKFCDRVPTSREIAAQKQSSSCDGSAPETYTRPLEKLRDCCDQAATRSGACLDDLLAEDLLIQRAFEQWKEPATKEQLVRQLHRCKASFGRRSQPSTGTKVIDPIVPLVNLGPCKSGTVSQNCVDYAARNITTQSYFHVCLNNKTNPAEAWSAETVHLRCFKQSGLSGLYQGLVDIADQVDNYCLQNTFGVAVTVESFNSYKTMENFITNINPDFYPMYMKSLWGVEDVTKQAAYDFLPDLCQNLAMGEHSVKCLETPVMMNHLNFRSSDSDLELINQCCAANAGNNDTLATCLDSKGLYSELYPNSGHFVRSIVREKAEKLFECVSTATDQKGTTHEYDKDMSLSERLKYFNAISDRTYKTQYEEAFNGTRYTITPQNYHFFLRNFTGDWADKACEACKEGERLGKTAYTFPALMCPGLVYEHYYRPVVNQMTCPDKIFYQVQVAHYCCLYAAFHKFDYANFAENQCPDYTGL
jgi:hypothetical protein